MALPKVGSGARAILKLDGNVAVYAMGVSYSIDTEYKEISGIDNSIPSEMAPANIKVEVTCTNLRVPKESATVLGLQPTMLNHLHQRYIAIEIRDRGTNDVLLYVPKAMMVRRSGDVRSRSLSSETWTFRGIGFWDERPPEQAQQASNSPSNIISGVANLAKKITTGE